MLTVLRLLLQARAWPIGTTIDATIPSLLSASAGPDAERQAERLRAGMSKLRQLRLMAPRHEFLEHFHHTLTELMMRGQYVSPKRREEVGCSEGRMLAVSLQRRSENDLI